MVGAQLLLAFSCALLGLSAPVVLQILARITGGTEGAPQQLQQVWTLPLPLLVVALGTTAAAMTAWVSVRSRAQPVRRYITWECGFGDLGPRMQYTATSFAQPIARMFGAIYHYALEVSIGGRDRRHFPETVEVESSYEPYLETRIYGPLVKLLQHLAGTFAMRLQAGSIHQYLLYMGLALVVLLWLGYHA